MNDEIKDLKKAAEAALKREPRDHVARDILRFLEMRDPANPRHQEALGHILRAWKKAGQRAEAHWRALTN